MDISQVLQNSATTGNISGTGAITNSIQTPASTNESENPNSILGKDDFLKILITQLKYQDPTQPLEDKEFISQMAQFTTLEQMANISSGFEDLSRQQSTAYSLSLVGKEVELLTENQEIVRGVVSSVILDDEPLVEIGNQQYLLSAITTVRSQANSTSTITNKEEN